MTVNSRNAETPPADGRIAFLIPNLQGGGTQRVQLLLAKGAIELGHPVDIVVARCEGPLSAEIPSGANLVNLRGWTGWSPVRALRRYLRESRPEVIISALNQANLLSWMATRRFPNRPRILMTVHNHYGAKWQHDWTPSAPLRRQLFRRLYRNADAVVTVSEGLREFLVDEMRVSPDRVHAIANPIDLNRIQNLATATADHPWLSKDRSFPVWIAAGRLEPQKDYPTLLRAMRLLQGESAPKLLILGEGSEHSALESLRLELGLVEQVEFVGFQSNPYAWMAKADGYVLSSKWEGYPLVLLEARALGLPVVATDCPTGPKEMANRIGGISLVAIGDANALANELQTSTSSTPIEATRWGEQASCATIMQRYLDSVHPTSEDR